MGTEKGLMGTDIHCQEGVTFQGYTGCLLAMTHLLNIFSPKRIQSYNYPALKRDNSYNKPEHTVHRS